MKLQVGGGKTGMRWEGIRIYLCT